MLSHKAYSKIFLVFFTLIITFNFSVKNCYSSMSRFLREEAEEPLIENIYRIINTAYSFDLPGYIKELRDQDRYQESNKFEYAFSFTKNGNAYLIKNLKDDNYLCVLENNIDFRKIDNNYSKNFSWEIKFINESIYKISSVAKKSFLIMNKTEKVLGKGERLISYNIRIGDEKTERNVLGFEVFNSEWRLKPFYPATGYSDLFKIIRDCGDLIALKHHTQLKSIKTLPISSHDSDCLSVKCTDKTKIILNANSPHYKPSIREIFSIEDVFKSNPSITSSSSEIKITRVIETEEVFQTTIENSLTTTQRETKKVNEKNLQRKASEEGTETEKMDQTSFSHSLNTLLSIAVTKGSELSNTTGNRQSATVGTSTQESIYQDAGILKSIGITNDSGSSSARGSIHEVSSSSNHGEVNTQSVGVSASLNAGFNIGFASGGASVGMHADTTNQTSLSHTNTQNLQSSSNTTATQNTQKSSNTTLDTKRGQSQTKEKKEEKTQEQFAEETSRLSSTQEQQNQLGTLMEEKKDQTTINARKIVDTTELVKEHEQSAELGIEKSLNLTQIKSVTQKRNEKWFIEREFVHLPNTALKVSFFEEAIEAINHPFKVALHISGRVGFTFTDNVFINSHPHRDYLSDNIWFLSPATIFNYLKAPGYQVNEDGSVNYIIKGNINLKHPMNIFTVINQDLLPISLYKQDEVQMLPSSSEQSVQKMMERPRTEEKKRKRHMH